MNTINIGNIPLNILEVYSMPSKEFFSPLVSSTQAKAGDIIGIERKVTVIKSEKIDLFSKSRIIKQAQKPEWFSLTEHLPRRDIQGLKNSGTFYRLASYFKRTGINTPSNTTITILNECLIAKLEIGYTCLIREHSSSHNRIQILNDLQKFLPYWIKSQ
jgi:hypothetical protein